jgi:hypothetical protein
MQWMDPVSCSSAGLNGSCELFADSTGWTHCGSRCSIGGSVELYLSK